MSLNHVSLTPGGKLPVIQLPNLTVGEFRKTTLVVVYRGIFCPFCRMTLTELKAKHEALQANGIDVIAISADSADATAKFVAELGGLPFPVGHGLTVPQMRQLGTYVSSPTSYIDQPQDFSEPAWFLVRHDGTIHYLTYGSAPFSGRPVPDHLIAGWNFVKERSVAVPAFATYTWGSQ